MPVSRNQPSPQRQSVLSFVSPKVADLLFFETVDAQKIGNTPAEIEANLPAYGTAHPDTENFPTHTLCFVKQADPEGLFYQYYYAADRASQDDYNFEFSQADLGGNKYDTVVRTYVIKREDFDDDDTSLKAGDPMPNTALRTDDTKFFEVDKYILMTRKQKRVGDKELDGLFVVEQRVYFNRVDIVTHNMDSATGGVLARVEKVVYRGEEFNPPNATAAFIETIAEQDDDDKWGLDDDGRSWACEQVSYDWWKITIQDVIPQGLGSLYGGKLIRQYDTWQNFTWPSVVDGLVFTTADRKDGASQTSVTVRMKEGKQGGNWPTKMTVKQVWSKSVFSSGSLPTPTVFKTTSARYAGIQFKVSVTNVLTPAITLTDFIGTKHPTYKMGEYAFPKPWCQASDPTDWPESEFEAAVTQKPFRGGYLLEVVFVHPPS